MNHYDGPAFYRRFISNSRNAKQQQTKSSQADQISRISHSDGVKNDFQSNFNASESGSKLMKLTDAFTPNRDFKRKHNSADRKEKQVNAFYHRLIDELAKSNANCILLENAVNDEYQPSINYQIQNNTTSSDSSDSSEDNSSVEEISKEHVKSTVASSTAPKSSDNPAPLHQSERIQQSNVKSSSAVESSGSATENVKSSASPVVSAEVTSLSSSSSHEPSSDNPLQSVSQNETTAEKNDQSSHALGHSLDTIMDNEDQSEQRISLFDKPSQVNENQVNNNYQFPQFTLLNAPQREDDDQLDDWILKQSDVLDKTLAAFNVAGKVVDWTNGPTVTRFQVKLKLGVKVSRITNLNDDLKMALAAKDIRIEAPIPGQRTVGVEIPNPKPRPVMLSEVLESDKFQKAQSPLSAALGVDLSGQPQITDIRKMPHGLIAGATGSGKSVFINSILISLLYKATPADLRLILIDPKAVEMAPYDGIPHLLAPVISEPNEAAAALKWTVKEMDQRYERLAASGSRNIEQYNQQAIEHHQPNLKLPYIVLVIDELADLMMVASTEVQDYIVRITQKARAAGIHLLVATQRPSVDIITGTIKNNIPTRVAFMVSSQVDSRTIIDTAGAERLLGKGDMLYLGNGNSQAIRLQGTYVANDEIERVTAAVKKQGAPHYAFNPKALLKKVDRQEKQDDLLPQVLQYIANEKHVSTSKLQRVFSIGYNRAASLIDDLEQHGYVSGQHGSKPREVYLTKEDFKKLNL